MCWFLVFRVFFPVYEARFFWEYDEWVQFQTMWVLVHEHSLQSYSAAKRRTGQEIAKDIPYYELLRTQEIETVVYEHFDNRWATTYDDWILLKVIYKMVGSVGSNGKFPCMKIVKYNVEIELGCDKDLIHFQKVHNQKAVLLCEDYGKRWYRDYQAKCYQGIVWKVTFGRIAFSHMVGLTETNKGKEGKRRARARFSGMTYHSDL